jgi:hypothetical protein
VVWCTVHTAETGQWSEEIFDILTSPRVDAALVTIEDARGFDVEHG